jgi:hypothetical protein
MTEMQTKQNAATPMVPVMPPGVGVAKPVLAYGTDKTVTAPIIFMGIASLLGVLCLLTDALWLMHPGYLLEMNAIPLADLAVCAAVFVWLRKRKRAMVLPRLSFLAVFAELTAIVPLVMILLAIGTFSSFGTLVGIVIAIFKSPTLVYFLVLAFVAALAAMLRIRKYRGTLKGSIHALIALVLVGAVAVTGLVVLIVSVVGVVQAVRGK